MARINIDQTPVAIAGEIIPTEAKKDSPTEVKFGESEEGENIILLLRAHWITNFSWAAITFGLVVGPLLILPLLSAGTGLVLVAFWYLGTFTYAFLNFLYWYFNVYIVTNLRIIDTDWYSVVIRKVSSMNLAKIQDVSATQVGALSGVFDFGNVEIQTAAEEENFEFVAVPGPQLVAKKIDEITPKNA